MVVVVVVGAFVGIVVVLLLVSAVFFASMGGVCAIWVFGLSLVTTKAMPPIASARPMSASGCLFIR